MKIVVLNGSPKGMNSVTMHYVLYLQKRFPEHDFLIHNVCQDITKLEENEDQFREVVSTMEASDVVLWAFPLYFLLVHAHYKRFIELLFERRADASFRGKSWNRMFSANRRTSSGLSLTSAASRAN
ncbi:MAG: NAD(P)H-dependent oxidoreductase [Pirellulaceae bacterium]